MNPGEIYAKTEDGIRELKERKLNLPIALRSLLIMIDGRLSVADVLERAQALHVDLSAVATLEQAGLIAKRFSAPSVAETGSASVARHFPGHHAAVHCAAGKRDRDCGRADFLPGAKPGADCRAFIDVRGKDFLKSDKLYSLSMTCESNCIEKATN